MKYNISALPKVELHIHLDCSLSFEYVQSQMPGITFEEYSAAFVGPSKCNDLNAYLDYAHRALEIIQTAEQLEAVTADLVSQLLVDKVIYAEIRFAPFLHNKKGMTPHEVVEVVSKTLVDLEKEHGIVLRLILCTLRGFEDWQSMETVKLVEAFRHVNVVGFDIAGDEAGHGLESHMAAFDYARQNGIGTTAHAGEAKGPQSVKETLELLNPARLGHGTKTHLDNELVQKLKSGNTHLEVCLTSNVQTNTVADYKEHPLPLFYKAGLSLSINTDGRTITNTSLAQEFQLLNEHYGYGLEEWYYFTCEAIKHAFTGDDIRKELRQHIDHAYQKQIETT